MCWIGVDVCVMGRWWVGGWRYVEMEALRLWVCLVCSGCGCVWCVEVCGQAQRYVGSVCDSVGKRVECVKGWGGRRGVYWENVGRK